MLDSNFGHTILIIILRIVIFRIIIGIELTRVLALHTPGRSSMKGILVYNSYNKTADIQLYLVSLLDLAAPA